MKIKDEIDLTNILAMAFSQYANKVQNGAVAPYKAFLTGENTVSVLVHLNDDGSVAVSSPIVEPIVFPNPIATEDYVTTTNNHVRPPESLIVQNDGSMTSVETEVIEEKPKRKRKTI